MDDFFAVIVLYKMNLQNSSTFLSISKSLELHNQTLDVMVYDNTPEFNTSLHNLQKPVTIGNTKVSYCADWQNNGVSKAYNVACEVAENKGKRYLLLLDQDTSFPEDTIPEYRNAINQYPDDVLFAPIMMIAKDIIISPCKFKFMRGFPLKTISKGVNSLAHLSVINCGMCVQLQAFKKNRGYNEILKLDFSDHDFINRFKKSVTERFIVIDLKVRHELSTTIRNSEHADLIRFDYYLIGANNASANFAERLFLKFNAMLRTFKLVYRHKNFVFLKKIIWYK